ncbi:hypothetical protein X566_00725 [Afipia sp. P52-10]|jgi:hypothetical protein|nr:hypothetical protein X566_00725 [Afipia sp. P52-10]
MGGKQLTEQERRTKWNAMCDAVADQMRAFTRPYVSVLAGEVDIGTGTFIENSDAQILTCAHVARFDPTAFYVDHAGSVQLQPGMWRMEGDPKKDVAISPLPEDEWAKVCGRASTLSISRFAQIHEPVKDELLFFRGIAGENANYIGNFGTDVILSGYCSQEKHDTGDGEIFEVLWKGGQASVTSGTDSSVRDRVLYDNPAGFSGSLVWNTRFVELGCDLSTWTPDDAIITGLLRRYDEATETLLVWRIEHVRAWL